MHFVYKMDNGIILVYYKVGMVSSFHPHGMCKIVERVKEKTGQSLSEYHGFERELIGYTGNSFF